MFMEYVNNLISLSMDILLVVKDILKFLKLEIYCMLNFINVQM